MRRFFDIVQTWAGCALIAVLLFGSGAMIADHYDLFEAEAAPVKKSRSGICHCPGGSYYEKTKNFKAFSTVDLCLESGGRAPKRGQGDCSKATPTPGSPATIKNKGRKIERESSTTKRHESWPARLPLRVIDGDSLEIAGRKVRLHGIDAPETGQTCRDDKGRPYGCGERATGALILMAAGGLRCALAGDEIDRYGRLIATCYAVDGVNINAEMVSAGYALAYRQYSKEYVEKESKARDGKKGMHRGAFVPPWDWRRGKRLD